MTVGSTFIELHIFRICKSDPGEIEFLLLKRAPDDSIYPKTWQMVSGRIEEGETAYQAALREMKEETGLECKQFWTAPVVNSVYFPNDDRLNMIPVFAALVDKKAQVMLSEEHTEFRWVKKGRARTLLAWEGQRNAVNVIHDYFTKKKKFLKFVEIENR